MKRICFILLLCALPSWQLSAEAPAPKANPPTAKDQATSSTTIKDAALDAKGRIIFYNAAGRDVELREGQDFGMMVFYNQYEEHPAPSYRLFLQKEKKLIRTDSFTDFEAGLDRIPAGSKVFLFDLCSSGSHSGMPGKFMKQIKTAMKKRRLTLADPGYIICTCRG